MPTALARVRAGVVVRVIGHWSLGLLSLLWFYLVLLVTKFPANLFLASLLLSLKNLPAEDWALEGYRCRRLFEVKGKVTEAGTAGRARFLTFGFTKPDATDVRVQGPNGPLPFQILSTGLDLCRLAVELQPGLERFYIYYGHPQPGEAPPPMAIQCGLVLETRHYNGGDCQTWTQMEATLKSSGPLHGRDLLPNVFHGFNLFGPSDNYVSLYEGWLWPPRSGEYLFATTSDDASFLFLDGKLEVAKGGWGGAPGQAHYVSKPLSLKAGQSYPFKYYHVEGGGEQAAVAAWKPPGGEFEVIPPSAFHGVLPCSQLNYEIRGWPIAPDFEATHQGEAVFQGKTCFRYLFRDSTPGDTLSYEPQWDFGDGCTSTDRNPMHIYLEPGTYTVTFALSREGRAHRVSLRILVNGDWENQLRIAGDDVADYYPYLKKYDFHRMSTGALEYALAIFRFLGKPDEILEAAHALLLRDEIISDEARVFEAALEYGRQLRGRPGSQAKAIETFLFADEHVKQPVRKARLRFEIGEVFFFFQEDYDRARTQYESILKEFSDLKDHLLRQAQIRLGEIQMRYGDHEKALAAFEEAEKMPSTRRAFDQNLVLLGALPQRVEDYLRRGELDAAEQELNLWEWEYPKERLTGCSALWRVRLAQARGQHDEAIKLARILSHVSPGSHYAVEILLEAVESYEAKKDFEAARQILERILAQYPETPLQAEAKTRLEALQVKQR